VGARHGSAVNAEAVGLRSVICSNDASKVSVFWRRASSIPTTTGSTRFKENSERMRTGSLLEVAVVLKSLVSSAGASRFPSAKRNAGARQVFVISEMATARNTTSESAEGLVVKSLAEGEIVQFPLMTEKFE